MNLLKQIDSWMMLVNNIFLNVRFSIIEPDQIQIITEGESGHIFEFKEVNGKIVLKKKKELFAIIEKFNQKTLRYIEFKNNTPCFQGFLY